MGKKSTFNKISKQSRTLKEFQGRNGTPCGCLMLDTIWHEHGTRWHAYFFSWHVESGGSKDDVDKSKYGPMDPKLNTLKIY